MLRRSCANLWAKLLVTSALLAGCHPTPDYRVTLHDIPSDTAVLLIAWKSDDDTVSRTSLAVPVADFSDEQRAK